MTVLLTTTGVVIAILLGALAILAGREERWWLVPADLMGLAAALLAVTLTLRGLPTGPLGLAVVSVISIVLVVNLVVALFDLHSSRSRRETKDGLPRPGVLYRMISDPEEIQTAIASKESDEVTEGVQALELWEAGNQAYVEGNYLDALSKYDFSARWIPSVPAYVNASAVCLELERYDEAERYAGFAVELREDCVEAWLNRGLALDRQRKLPEALEAYRRVTEAEPENAPALMLMGRVLRRLNRLDEAEQVLERGLQIDGDNPELLFEKSLVLIRKGRREEALPHLVEAVRRNPKHHSAYFHLANTLNRLGKAPEALHYYNLVIKLKPDYPEAWNNRGIALSRLGKLKKAIESYQKALTLRPEYCEAWLNLALAHDSRGDAEEALRAYRRFLELAPSSMTKYIELTKQRIDELQRKVAASEVTTRTAKTEQAEEGSVENVGTVRQAKGEISPEREQEATQKNRRDH